MNQKTKTSKPSYSISEELTIYTVSRDFDSIVSLLKEHSLLELDLAAVTSLDCAGVQMLMLIKQVAARHQKEIQFVNHSPAVIEVMDLINVSAFFGDPVVIAANQNGGLA